MERRIMGGKYRIIYSGKITGRIPNYILSLRAHLKSIFSEMEQYDKEEFSHVLHCISSFIDDFTFKIRNSRYRGDILKRTISDNYLKVFNLSNEKVVLAVSFIPLET